MILYDEEMRERIRRVIFLFYVVFLDQNKIIKRGRYQSTPFEYKQL